MRLFLFFTCFFITQPTLFAQSQAKPTSPTLRPPSTVHRPPSKDSRLPYKAKVAPYQGRPTIFINEKPYSPHIYALTHVYGGRWSWEERPARNLRNFCEAGIRLYQVDLYLEDIWYKGAKTLDIDKARRQVRGVLDACPEAVVFVRLHVNAPFWWNAQHPDECSVFANGPLDQRPYGPPFNNEDGDTGRPVRASLASIRWREEAGARVREFCSRLARTSEGKHVAGIHVAGGLYGEWHYWGFIDHEPDTGPAMTSYFRQWLRKKYGSDTALQQVWQTEQYTLESATVVWMVFSATRPKSGVWSIISSPNRKLWPRTSNISAIW
jgi:beta-galactosidase